jgi:hypothetical protein
MSKNSIEHFKSRISELPTFSVNGDALIFDEPINTDQVYEMAFEGNDAEAEMIENSTYLYRFEHMNLSRHPLQRTKDKSRNLAFF